MRKVLSEGIDTSKWQNSKVDYKNAKENGVDFVILRIGYNNTKDSKFENDYKSAIESGLKVGVYFYTLSLTTEQAVQDATRVLGWLNNRHLDLPIYYDVEDNTQKGKDRNLMNSYMYNAFADKIKSNGIYKVGVYSGEYFFKNYFAQSLIKDSLWIAKYSNTEPSVNRDVDIWQFSSDAINSSYYKGKLDRNRCYVNFEDSGTKTQTNKKDNYYPIPTRTLKKTIPNMRGNDVKWLQFELGIKEDGIFGNQTKQAVIEYQAKHGLKKDGIVGSATRYSLLND